MSCHLIQVKVKGCRRELRNNDKWWCIIITVASWSSRCFLRRPMIITTSYRDNITVLPLLIQLLPHYIFQKRRTKRWLVNMYTSRLSSPLSPLLLLLLLLLTTATNATTTIAITITITDCTYTNNQFNCFLPLPSFWNIRIWCISILNDTKDREVTIHHHHHHHHRRRHHGEEKQGQEIWKETEAE